MNLQSGRSEERLARRSVLFPDGRHEVPVYLRSQIKPGEVIDGPCLVEEIDTTIVVLPGWSLERDDLGCLVARRVAAHAPTDARGAADALAMIAAAEH